MAIGGKKLPRATDRTNKGMYSIYIGEGGIIIYIPIYFILLKISLYYRVKTYHFFKTTPKMLQALTYQ